MKVLVTGGGGFAGRHLLRALVDGGYSEIAATALDEVPSWALEESPDRVRWFTMDVRKMDSVRGVIESFRPTHVFHLAGQASVSRSFDLPLETWEVNATGTLRVLTALRLLEGECKRLLLVSSAEVYGLVAEEEQPIREDAPYRPVTPYGASKAAAEIVALQESRSNGIEVVIARSFNHVGPGQDDRFLVPSIARQLARIKRGEEEPVLRAGNLSIDRDFLDVRDAVRAYVRVMERGDDRGAYNVCSGVARSVADVVRRAIELSMTGAALELDPDRVRAVDIPSLRGDSSRIRELGWKPEVELDRTLRDLFEESFEGRRGVRE